MIPWKRLSQHLIFWTIAGLFLVLFIGYKQAGFLFTLLFVFMLIPIAAITSYIFNYFLLQKLLFQQQYLKFGLYSGFLFIASVYMQTMVMILFFVVMADYAIEKMSPIGSNLVVLGVGNYFIIFLNAIIYLIKRWSQPEEKKEVPVIVVKSDRKNVPIKIQDILFIESLSNYVQIHTDQKVIITKEKISSFESKLEDAFLRIHRSYLINKAHISSYTKETVEIGGQQLTISRTYKKGVIEELSSNV